MTQNEFEHKFGCEVLSYILESRTELLETKRSGVLGFEVDGQVLRLGFSWCNPGEQQVMIYE